MKKSILILIGIFFILSVVVFAQPGDHTGVRVTILEEPMIFLGDDEHGNDTTDNDGEIWATLTTDTQVENCEINWGESWQVIDKTIISINHIYFSEGIKTVYYQCYDDNDNFVTVNDSILVGECIECSSDLECGTNDYTGNLFCQDDNVVQDYITYTCNNPGEFDSYCSDSITPKLIEECAYITPKLLIEEYGGCTEGRCKVEVCEEVCWYSGCKTYCKWE